VHLPREHDGHHPRRPPHRWSVDVILFAVFSDRSAVVGQAGRTLTISSPRSLPSVHGATIIDGNLYITSQYCESDTTIDRYNLLVDALRYTTEIRGFLRVCV
jgi:hypothetical protein